jgi:hypothetical protein
VTTPDDDRDPIGTAQDLTGALEGVSAELGRLAAYGWRNRLLIWITIGSLCLDLLLTGWVYHVSSQAHGTAAELARTSASNLALCQASNVSRAQTIDLWKYVEGLGTKPQTAAQKAQVAKFDRYLNTLYGPRDCAALGKGS